MRPPGGEPAKGEIYDLFLAYDASGASTPSRAAHGASGRRCRSCRWTVTIAPGKCLSGWVLLSAPKNTKLVTVDMNDGEGGSVAEWKVG